LALEVAVGNGKSHGPFTGRQSTTQINFISTTGNMHSNVEQAP